MQRFRDKPVQPVSILSDDFAMAASVLIVHGRLCTLGSETIHIVEDGALFINDGLIKHVGTSKALLAAHGGHNDILSMPISYLGRLEDVGETFTLQERAFGDFIHSSSSPSASSFCSRSQAP